MSEYPNNGYVDLEYIYNINYVIGGVLLATSVLLIFIQISIFIILWKNPEMLKNMHYRLMRHLCFTQLIQQICHFVSSIYSIFLIRPIEIIGNIIASMLQTFYLSSITILFVLSLNRFDIIFNRIIFQSLNREKFFYYYIIINYIWNVPLFAFFMVPNFELYFSLYDYGWKFNRTTPNWKIALTVENRYVITLLSLSFIIYVIIIGRIVKIRSYASRNINISFSEIILFIQGVLTFLFIVFIEACWSFLSKYLPQSKYTFTVLNYLYLLSTGTHSILNIIFVKELRLGFRKLLCLRKRGANNSKMKSLKLTAVKIKHNYNH
uniref:7TM_GPCR_Srx domain-containing protein n=1 Tax=Strongyloides venezuelensis TaxID=75913 RepID=A0A0K0F4D0_STRVS